MLLIKKKSNLFSNNIWIIVY